MKCTRERRTGLRIINRNASFRHCKVTFRDVSAELGEIQSTKVRVIRAFKQLSALWDK